MFNNVNFLTPRHYLFMNSSGKRYNFTVTNTFSLKLEYTIERTLKN